jgi:hypothetical protein
MVVRMARATAALQNPDRIPLLSWEPALLSTFWRSGVVSAQETSIGRLGVRMPAPSAPRNELRRLGCGTPERMCSLRVLGEQRSCAAASFSVRKALRLGPS